MFTQHRRKQIAELRPWNEGDDMSRISISAADKEAGSPRAGDMIARNPKNHDDEWLVAAQYFADNFEPVGPVKSPGKVAYDAYVTVRQYNSPAPFESLTENDRRAWEAARTAGPMTLGEALRDAVVTAEGALKDAVLRSLPGEPAEDQAVQWWGGHVATWRAALGDPPADVVRAYEAIVAEARATQR